MYIYDIILFNSP